MGVTQGDSVRDRFDLSDRVAIITGGGGFFGVKHAEAIAEMGAVPVLLDVDLERAEANASEVADRFGVPAVGLEADITEPQQVSRALDKVLNDLGRVDILINNAANDPKVGGAGQSGFQWSRLENFPMDVWRQDLAVGLTGAFVSSQIFGGEMARARKREWC